MKKYLAAFLTLVISGSMVGQAFAYPLIIEERFGNRIVFSDISSGPEEKEMTFITGIMDKPGVSYDDEAEWTEFRSDCYTYRTEKQDVSLYVMAPNSTATVDVKSMGRDFDVSCLAEIDGMYVHCDSIGFEFGKTMNLEQAFGKKYWVGPVSMISFTDKNNKRICVLDGKTGATVKTETEHKNYAGFADVPDNAYYAVPVHWAMEHKLVSGTSDTTFSPDDVCTTGQILTFLWRSNGSPEPSIGNPFRSLDTGKFYAKAAIWAYEKGIISDTNFNGEALCTRSTAVEYIWKMWEKPDAEPTSFTDVNRNAEYAKAVDWAVKTGITSGTEAGKFSPEATCTRGQIVTFLYRFFAQLK